MPNLMVGGQAVLEGVMMRAPGIMTIAVRRKNGSIQIHTDVLRSVSDRFHWLRKPFIRGVLALFQSLILGFKALNYSSAAAMEDLDEADGKSETRKRTDPEKNAQSLSTGYLILVIAATLVLAIGFFFFLPLVLTEWVSTIYPVAKNSLVFNFVDGVIRIIFLLAYIYVISLMPDIRRVFQYHGAEHKAIHAYEAGLPLTVESTKKFSTLHPRCGTAFLLTVMIVAMLMFTLIPSHYPLWIKALCRLVLLPLIAGISFELIKRSSEQPHPVFRMMIIPGLWLQKITTREPDDHQVEVSLAALKTALEQSQPASMDIII